jgi:hypothetical protein
MMIINMNKIIPWAKKPCTSNAELSWCTQIVEKRHQQKAGSVQKQLVEGKNLGR